MSRTPTAISFASVGVRTGPSNNELQRTRPALREGASPLNSVFYGRVKASAIWQLEQDDVRLFSCPIEDDLATVPGYVEIADGELAAEIGELPLATGLEIDGPELLVGDVSFHDDERIVPVQKEQTSGA